MSWLIRLQVTLLDAGWPHLGQESASRAQRRPSPKVSALVWLQKKLMMSARESGCKKCNAHKQLCMCECVVIYIISSAGHPWRVKREAPLVSEWSELLSCFALLSFLKRCHASCIPLRIRTLMDQFSLPACQSLSVLHRFQNINPPRARRWKCYWVIAARAGTRSPRS